MEDRASVPLILVCSAHGIQSLRELFSDNEYFAFDSQKVSIYSHMKNTSFDWDVLLKEWIKLYIQSITFILV